MEISDLTPENSGASKPALDAAIAIASLDGCAVLLTNDYDFPGFVAHMARVIDSHFNTTKEEFQHAN
jgi:hypothetical protein